MLDTYVSARLVKWAEWVGSSKKVYAELWYPKKSCIANFNGDNGIAVSVQQYEQECYEVDQCVLKLGEDLKCVVISCYLDMSDSIQKYRRCGCTKEDYDLRLTMAHNELLGLLNDYVANH